MILASELDDVDETEAVVLAAFSAALGERRAVRVLYGTREVAPDVRDRAREIRKERG